MKTFTNKYEVAAMRNILIRAIFQAFPQIKKLRVAQMLNLDHGTVLYHCSRRYKGASDAMFSKAWSSKLNCALGQLANGDAPNAANTFEALAKELRQLS